MIYATRDDAIAQTIRPALGEYVVDFDVDAIADDVLTWNGNGYVIVDTDMFWRAVERHAIA